MKRKIRRDRLFFIMMIVSVLLAMPTIVKDEIARRGYFAIGGEWLIIPVICLLWYFTEVLRKLLHTIKKGELGKEGPRGLQGPKGDKGDPGYTPIKGIDYFDCESPKGDIEEEVK